MRKIIIISLLLTVTLTVGCVETKITEESDEIYPTFDLDVSVVTNSSYNSYTSFNEDEKEFTVPASAWTVSHVIKDVDNNPWYDPRMQFEISLVPKKIATTDDQGAIYFSVQDLERRVDSEGGNFRLITKSGGWYQAVWRCGDDIWYEGGILTLNVLDTETLTLDFDVNQVGMSYMGPANKMVLPVVFANVDNTWSETYNVTFRVIREVSL